MDREGGKEWWKMEGVWEGGGKKNMEVGEVGREEMV